MHLYLILSIKIFIYLKIFLKLFLWVVAVSRALLAYLARAVAHTTPALHPSYGARLSLPR
jgi:hypothetical protein